MPSARSNTASVSSGGGAAVATSFGLASDGFPSLPPTSLSGGLNSNGAPSGSNSALDTLHLLVSILGLSIQPVNPGVPPPSSSGGCGSSSSPSLPPPLLPCSSASSAHQPFNLMEPPTAISTSSTAIQSGFATESAAFTRLLEQLLFGQNAPTAQLPTSGTSALGASASLPNQQPTLVSGSSSSVLASFLDTSSPSTISQNQYHQLLQQLSPPCQTSSGLIGQPISAITAIRNLTFVMLLLHRQTRSESLRQTTMGQASFRKVSDDLEVMRREIADMRDIVNGLTMELESLRVCISVNT
ncbi:unnamed protein product [Protopolystoma xenopodis]|uniref:Uncharacterized protein n=1 Tax=Protopolystoma xenopodis TaxID=117903 RepID=A0A448XK10_9PLAT|nr:unnamed protein product [Protopolystoma xenopodis]